MNFDNQMSLAFSAKSENEGFARSTVAAFCVKLEPTLNEINDIKTAVSEAVTNSIVHAYNKESLGKVIINVGILKNEVYITISDFGKGIDNIELARQPFYTTKPEEERSGMGFTVMEAFMNSLEVKNNKDGGVTVSMKKVIGSDRG